jgi:glycosyltransferase involved in cell wall biosynthesis
VALLETLGKLQHENIFGLLAGTVLPDAQSSVTNRSSNARIIGPLTEQERRDFYASIDLFCLPSVIDSFGLVLLEAWSAGVPCVVFGAGGPGSIVRHGLDGLIIPESDSHYLESALAELCRSAETRKTMGNAGTLRVLTEFTEEKRYSHLARLIESTLHNRKY